MPKQIKIQTYLRNLLVMVLIGGLMMPLLNSGSMFAENNGLAIVKPQTDAGKETSTDRNAAAAELSDSPANPNSDIVEANLNPETAILTAAQTATVPNYEGSITFISSNGQDSFEQTINYTNGDQTLNYGNDLNDADKGGGISKKYFVCWSDVANYNGETGQGFYSNEKIKDVFPDGLAGGKKLYAAYLSASTALYLNKKINADIYINQSIPDQELMYGDLEFIQSTETDTQITKDYYFQDNGSDVFKIKLGATMVSNPFVQAVVRNDKWFAPGSAEYYGNIEGLNTAVNIKDMPASEQYTFMDLHISLDQRVKTNTNLNFIFKSYAWYPHMIFKAAPVDDGSGKMHYTPFANVQITMNPNDPNAEIILPIETEKEFVLRVRVRNSRVKPDSVIKDVSYAEANQPMRLISSSDDNFKVAKSDVLAIAKGEAEPLQFSGFIRGGAKLYEKKAFFWKVGGASVLPETKAKDLVVNYQLPEVVSPTEISTGSAFDNLGSNDDSHCYTCDLNKEIPELKDSVPNTGAATGAATNAATGAVQNFVSGQKVNEIQAFCCQG